jgi:lysophospholipase L1-like esterase
MSEWYDSQKKPSSDFRKLLKERLDSDNPRRKELAKLESIAARLKRGEHVQNRQLQTWLSDDGTHG